MISRSSRSIAIGKWPSGSETNRAQNSNASSVTKTMLFAFASHNDCNMWLFSRHSLTFLCPLRWGIGKCFRILEGLSGSLRETDLDEYEMNIFYSPEDFCERHAMLSSHSSFWYFIAMIARELHPLTQWRDARVADPQRSRMKISGFPEPGEVFPMVVED